LGGQDPRAPSSRDFAAARSGTIGRAGSSPLGSSADRDAERPDRRGVGRLLSVQGRRHRSSRERRRRRPALRPAETEAPAAGELPL
jgi:hypothetical protein